MEEKEGGRWTHGGLDGNSTLLLVRSGVHVSVVSGLGSGDDTSLGDEGVGKGGLSVIDWREGRKKRVRIEGQLCLLYFSSRSTGKDQNFEVGTMVKV